ncbi:Amino-acid acetyltransferase, mitochondrial [Geranomyces variabilis]|nr:Amino-acid acetyltransferase, mitochondrial [Geranomyces variabilis]
MHRTRPLFTAIHRRPRATQRLHRWYSSSTSQPPDPHPKPASGRQFILDVLNAKPSQREARQFLKRFNPLPSKTTAGHRQGENEQLTALADTHDVGVHPATQLGLVSLEHDVVDARLPRLAETLVHLHKLGMTPLVVVQDHVAGGTERERRDLLLARVFRVVDLIDTAGGRGMALYTGVFSRCEDSLTTDLGAINTALSLGHIPVLAPFASTPNLAATILPARPTLIALSRSLSASDLPTPLKLILVNNRGGLAPARDSAIGFVNLEDEYADVVNGLEDAAAACADDVARQELSAMHNELDTARKILDVLPSSSSAVIASVTSSAALISNLITDKPLNAAQSMSLDITSPLSGPQESPQHTEPDYPRHLSGRPATTPTVLRHGLRVVAYTQPDWASKVDIVRMSTLLERSFQKPLRSDAFWNRMHGVLHQVIIAGAYDGAAIVTHEAYPTPTTKTATADSAPLPPIPYLDKFAVAPTSQGIGVADILWKQLRKRYPDLVWRSRASNPVNKWYFERCDGTVRLSGSPWQMFWYGPRGADEVKAYAEMAGAVPASFHAAKTST